MKNQECSSYMYIQNAFKTILNTSIDCMYNELA